MKLHLFCINLSKWRTPFTSPGRAPPWTETGEGTPSRPSTGRSSSHVTRFQHPGHVTTRHRSSHQLTKAIGWSLKASAFHFLLWVTFSSDLIRTPSLSQEAYRKLYITVTSSWAWWRHKSPASRLFTRPFIQTQIKENIKAPCHWPLSAEFTGDQLIPRTNSQWRGKCFHLMTSSWVDHPSRTNMTDECQQSSIRGLIISITILDWSNCIYYR